MRSVFKGFSHLLQPNSQSASVQHLTVPNRQGLKFKASRAAPSPKMHRRLLFRVRGSVGWPVIWCTPCPAQYISPACPVIRCTDSCLIGLIFPVRDGTAASGSTHAGCYFVYGPGIELSGPPCPGGLISRVRPGIWTQAGIEPPRMMPCYLVYTLQAPAGRAVKCCTAKVCGVQGHGLIFGVRPFVVTLQVLVAMARLLSCVRCS